MPLTYVINMTLDTPTLISTAVGALIGSALTLIAAVLTHQLDLRRQKDREKRLLHGLLQAIHDEIETLWDQYINGIGNHLEVLLDGQPLLLYYPATQDYFTIYSGNASFIGQIQNNDLRKAIVTTYSKGRAILDSYRMNNEILQKYEHWSWMHHETQNLVHKAKAEAEHTSLVCYAHTLKNYHQNLKERIQTLLRMLRKEGVLLSEKKE